MSLSGIFFLIFHFQKRCLSCVSLSFVNTLTRSALVEPPRADLTWSQNCALWPWFQWSHCVIDYLPHTVGPVFCARHPTPGPEPVVRVEPATSRTSWSLGALNLWGSIGIHQMFGCQSQATNILGQKCIHLGNLMFKSVTVSPHTDMRSRIRLASQREIAVAYGGPVGGRGWRQRDAATWRRHRHCHASLISIHTIPW